MTVTVNSATPITRKQLVKMLISGKPVITTKTIKDDSAILIDGLPLLDFLLQLCDGVAYKAHIAGSESTKGIGLNISKEDRAAEYCREKGLRS